MSRHFEKFKWKTFLQNAKTRCVEEHMHLGSGKFTEALTKKSWKIVPQSEKQQMAVDVSSKCYR